MPIHSRYTPTKKTVLSEDHIVKYDNRIAFIDRRFLSIHDDTFLVMRTKIDPSPHAGREQESFRIRQQIS